MTEVERETEVIEVERETEVHEDRVEVSEDPTKFRNLVKEVSKVDISSKQAANFLDIFGEELEQTMVTAKRKFIEKHFGVKSNGTNSTGPGA